MPLVRDVMTRRPVTVSPDDTVRTAMDLLRFGELEMLPVVREGALVGAVRPLALFRFYGEMPVAAAMTAPPPVVAPDISVGAAAEKMAEAGAGVVAVVREGVLVGLLTERDLAACWGSVPDPLTGLPWQDQMRRWASSHLLHNREVAILFLDLDGFGIFNKEHGHVHGDHALKAVAEALRSGVDPEQDSLCRYGGDEFVVATTRPLIHARALADALKARVLQATMPSGTAPLSIAVGIAGGQRTSQRPGSHAPATLDDLLNLASRASTRAKEGLRLSGPEERGGGPAMTTLPAGQTALDDTEPLRLARYQVNLQDDGVCVEVTLSRGEQTASGATPVSGDDLLRAAAEATAAAASGLLPGISKLEVTEVYTSATGDRGEVVAVALTPFGSGRAPGEERLHGSAPMLSDPARSAILAVLDAASSLAVPAAGPQAAGEGTGER